MPGVCQGCGQGAAQWCGCCKKVAYCSRECQVHDWHAYHKHEARTGAALDESLARRKGHYELAYKAHLRGAEPACDSHGVGAAADVTTAPAPGESVTPAADKPGSRPGGSRTAPDTKARIPPEVQAGQREAIQRIVTTIQDDMSQRLIMYQLENRFLDAMDQLGRPVDRRRLLELRTRAIESTFTAADALTSPVGTYDPKEAAGHMASLQKLQRAQISTYYEALGVTLQVPGAKDGLMRHVRDAIPHIKDFTLHMAATLTEAEVDRIVTLFRPRQDDSDPTPSGINSGYGRPWTRSTTERTTTQMGESGRAATQKIIERVVADTSQWKPFAGDAFDYVWQALFGDGARSQWWGDTVYLAILSIATLAIIFFFAFVIFVPLTGHRVDAPADLQRRAEAIKSQIDASSTLDQSTPLPASLEGQVAYAKNYVQPFLKELQKDVNTPPRAGPESGTGGIRMGDFSDYVTDLFDRGLDTGVDLVESVQHIAANVDQYLEAAQGGREDPAITKASAFAYDQIIENRNRLNDPEITEAELQNVMAEIKAFMQISPKASLEDVARENGATQAYEDTTGLRESVQTLSTAVVEILAGLKGQTYATNPEGRLQKYAVGNTVLTYLPEFDEYIRLLDQDESSDSESIRGDFYQKISNMQLSAVMWAKKQVPSANDALGTILHKLATNTIAIATFNTSFFNALAILAEFPEVYGYDTLGGAVLGQLAGMKALAIALRYIGYYLLRFSNTLANSAGIRSVINRAGRILSLSREIVPSVTPTDDGDDDEMDGPLRRPDEVLPLPSLRDEFTSVRIFVEDAGILTTTNLMAFMFKHVAAIFSLLEVSVPVPGVSYLKAAFTLTNPALHALTFGSVAVLYGVYLHKTLTNARPVHVRALSKLVETMGNKPMTVANLNNALRYLVDRGQISNEEIAALISDADKDLSGPFSLVQDEHMWECVRGADGRVQMRLTDRWLDPAGDYEVEPGPSDDESSVTEDAKIGSVKPVNGFFSTLTAGATIAQFLLEDGTWDVYKVASASLQAVGVLSASGYVLKGVLNYLTGGRYARNVPVNIGGRIVFQSEPATASFVRMFADAVRGPLAVVLFLLSIPRRVSYSGTDTQVKAYLGSLILLIGLMYADPFSVGQTVEQATLLSRELPLPDDVRDELANAGLPTMSTFGELSDRATDALRDAYRETSLLTSLEEINAHFKANLGDMDDIASVASRIVNDDAYDALIAYIIDRAGTGR